MSAMTSVVLPLLPVPLPASLLLHPSFLSLFICPSCTLPLCTVIRFSPSVSLSIFTLLFSLPPLHVVLLSIPLYSVPLSLPLLSLLSSLTHIWFLSLDPCVFGVTESSLGLPARVCYRHREGGTVHSVCLQAQGFACPGSCACWVEFSRAAARYAIVWNVGHLKETWPSFASPFCLPPHILAVYLPVCKHLLRQFQKLANTADYPINYKHKDFVTQANLDLLILCRTLKISAFVYSIWSFIFSCFSNRFQILLKTMNWSVTAGKLLSQWISAFKVVSFCLWSSCWTCLPCGTGPPTWLTTANPPANTWGWTHTMRWPCWRS